MMHEWLILDGPAHLTNRDVGTPQAFTIQLPDGTSARLTIALDTVGRMFGGAIKSFSGTMHVGPQAHEIIGTYNVLERTGHCHTTALR